MLAVSRRLATLAIGAILLTNCIQPPPTVLPSTAPPATSTPEPATTTTTATPTAIVAAPVCAEPWRQWVRRRPSGKRRSDQA
jgi:hypothetical protein